MLRHFRNLTNSNFDKDNTLTKDHEALLKSGIVFYESSAAPHTDSKGKTWVMSADDIVQLADNTNALLSKSEIPILIEHDKHINSVVGVIEHPTFEARLITAEDIAGKPKLANLLNKMAVFCHNAKILDPKVIEKALYGIPLKVSAGIDMVNKVIKELSIVTLPALDQATLFHRSNNNDLALTNFTYSLEEKIAQRQEQEVSRDEVHKLVDDFMDVLDSIQQSDPEQLAQNGIEDPQAAVMQNFESFEQMLMQMIGIGDNQEEEYEDPYAQQQPQPAPAQNPMMRNKTQAKYSTYNLPVTFAELNSEENTSNFAFRDQFNAARKKLPTWAPGYQAPNKPMSQPNKPSMLRRAGGLALKTAAVGALGAGAIRYGGAALQGAKVGAKIASNRGITAGKNIGLQAMAAKRSVGEQLRNDAGALRGVASTVRNRFKKPKPPGA